MSFRTCKLSQFIINEYQAQGSRHFLIEVPVDIVITRVASGRVTRLAFIYDYTLIEMSPETLEKYHSKIPNVKPNPKAFLTFEFKGYGTRWSLYGVRFEPPLTSMVSY